MIHASGWRVLCKNKCSTEFVCIAQWASNSYETFLNYSQYWHHSSYRGWQNIINTVHSWNLVAIFSTVLIWDTPLTTVIRGFLLFDLSLTCVLRASFSNCMQYLVLLGCDISRIARTSMSSIVLSIMFRWKNSSLVIWFGTQRLNKSTPI